VAPDGAPGRDEEDRARHHRARRRLLGLGRGRPQADRRRGGLWSSNLGHSNRRVRDAIVAQLDELPFYNTFRGTTHPRAIELSARW
jgi:adenosylmethionine-8-amino-7-oxononanoate aminotransferase